MTKTVTQDSVEKSIGEWGDEEVSAGVDEGATSWGGVDGDDSNPNGATENQDSKTEVAVPTNTSEVAIKKKFRPRPKPTRSARAPLKGPKKIPGKKALAKIQSNQSKAQELKMKSRGQARSQEVKAKSKPKTQKVQPTVKLPKASALPKGFDNMQGVISGYSFEDDDEGEFTVVRRHQKTNRGSKKKNKGRDSKRR